MKKVRQQEKPVISQNVPNVTQKQDATPKTMAELNFEKIQRDRVIFEFSINLCLIQI
ncbi:MAG: Protein fam32a, variant 2 [Marteilia pararefringens]